MPAGAGLFKTDDAPRPRFYYGPPGVIVPPVPDSEPYARFITPDGSDIAVHDLGGAGEPLLFAHATGFHALVFAELARELPFRSYGLDLRAHGCSRAAEGWGGEWAGFASDVLTVVEGLGLRQPYGFGHSCGGASLVLAEEAQPGTFRHLYCYEPIISPMLDPMPPSYTHALATGALKRRERFSSKAEALAHFSGKPQLASLDPVVLEAYVEHGFVEEPDGGVRLRCRPADEARTFANSMSHEAFRNLARVACPVDLACGGLTDSFGEVVVQAIHARFAECGGRSRVTVFEDLDHFGPLERADLVGEAVTQAFATPAAPAAAG